MITARLFGGEGDGLECSVLRANAHVTLIDGVPTSFSGDAHPDGDPALLVAAGGRWEVYARIQHLVPDDEGRLGYWCVDLLPSALRSRQATVDLSEERRDDVERALARLPGQYHWSTLKRFLTGWGYRAQESPGPPPNQERIDAPRSNHHRQDDPGQGGWA